MTTDDLAEAVLRPPGWETDVVLDEPTEVVAEVDLNVAGMAHGMLGLVVEPTPPTDDDAIAAAVAAAAEADVAVVVVGLTEEQETEALDKATLALPGRQDELVSAVAAVAPRTVVVVNAATPVLMPWRDEVDAILWAGIPGQEGGHAVAAALLNEIEPAGRLVTTFPVADGATPAWEVVPTDGALSYDEGTFIGYRGHAAGLAPEPAYWFGHGLGYGDVVLRRGARSRAAPCRSRSTNTSALRLAGGRAGLPRPAARRPARAPGRLGDRRRRRPGSRSP